MSIASTIGEYLEDFVDLIFPRVCLGCNTILLHQEEHVCMKCRLSLPKTNYHGYQDNPLYQKFVYEAKVSRVTAYLHFYKGGIAQKIIHELKYRSNPEPAEILSRLFARDLVKAEWKPDLILPIPIHQSKLKVRGYNQSEKIALVMADEFKVPVITQAIIRRVKTTSQTRKSKVERWINIESVYEVISADHINNRSILIVDDVLTTGATIGELVDLLVKSGAREIMIATLAAGK